MDSRFSDNTASGFDYLYLAHLSQLNDHSSLHYFSSVKIWIKRGSHKCPTVIQHTFQLPFLSRIAESKKFYNMKRGEKFQNEVIHLRQPNKNRIYLFNWIHCVSHFLLLDKPTFFVTTNEAKNSNTNELYWSDFEALSFCQSGSNFAKNWTANYCWK